LPAAEIADSCVRSCFSDLLYEFVILAVYRTLAHVFLL
jgi:hypothetical protein